MAMQIGNPSSPMTAIQLAQLQTDLRIPRVLKDSFTRYDLTGAGVTVGTEYEMLAVDLPAGCLLDYGAGIIIEAAWHYTANTNGKRFRVALGTSAASVQSLWEKTRTSGSQGQESTYIHLKRSTLSTTGCMTFGNNGVTTYGATPPATTSDPISTNTVDPSLTGLKLFFLGTLQTANTDLIRLASVRVTLIQAEA